MAHIRVRFQLRTLMLLVFGLSVALAAWRLVGIATILSLLAGAALIRLFVFLLTESLEPCPGCAQIVSDTMAECPWCNFNLEE